jgi:hypothetical protein
VFGPVLRAQGDAWRSTAGLYAYLIGAVLGILSRAIVAVLRKNTWSSRTCTNAEVTDEVRGVERTVQRFAGLRPLVEASSRRRSRSIPSRMRSRPNSNSSV